MSSFTEIGSGCVCQDLVLASTVGGISWISNIAAEIAARAVNSSIPSAEIVVSGSSGATFVTIVDVENDGSCAIEPHHLQCESCGMTGSTMPVQTALNCLHVPRLS